MGAVARLARTLRELARVPSQASAPFAAYITGELKSCLQGGVDPYGRPLPALKASTVRKKGHARILQENLVLLGQVKAIPLSGSGVGLDGGPGYGALHITGQGARGTVRAYLPINVMPAKWRAWLKAWLQGRARKVLS